MKTSECPNRGTRINGDYEMGFGRIEELKQSSRNMSTAGYKVADVDTSVGAGPKISPVGQYNLLTLANSNSKEKGFFKDLSDSATLKVCLLQFAAIWSHLQALRSN